jgi:RNA polymerase sigma-70 factor (ECF subfamily)
MNQVTSYHDIHKEIIVLSKAGNAKAQHQLYQLYARAMYNVCYRMMNNREEAEDMLQESFSEAFYRLDTFRFESAFGAWLKRITVNKCINALKKKRTNLVPMDNIPEPQEDYELPDDNKGLTIEAVQQAMEKLAEGYRVIFSLYMLEGYDHVEISQIMGISEETSKSQFSRAKKRMKEILIQQSYGRQL